MNKQQFKSGLIYLFQPCRIKPGIHLVHHHVSHSGQPHIPWKPLKVVEGRTPPRFVLTILHYEVVYCFYLWRFQTRKSGIFFAVC